MNLPKHLPSIIILISSIILLSIGGILLKRNIVSAEEASCPSTANHYKNVLAAPPLPEKLDFMGEAVPLDDYLVRESLDRELTTICYHHSTTILCLKRAGRWFPVIEKILQEEGLPDDFKYLCVAESSLTNATSPAKAVGFWQFLQNTAQLYGLEVREEVDERYDVEKATRAACKYLRNAQRRLGSWALAAAAYNMGENGVAKNIANQHTNNYWDTYFNPETARYAFRILAYKLVFENPHIYGVQINNADKYHPIPYRIDTVTTSIPDFYNYCKQQGITYKKFKDLNPWCRAKKLTIPAGKSYLIKIPTN